MSEDVWGNLNGAWRLVNAIKNFFFLLKLLYKYSHLECVLPRNENVSDNWGLLNTEPSWGQAGDTKKVDDPFWLRASRRADGLYNVNPNLP